MIRHTEISVSIASCVAVTAAALALQGCSDATGQQADAAAKPQPPATQPSAPSPSPAVSAIDPAVFSAATNQFAVTQQAQNELIQKLLARIESLEKGGAARATAESEVQRAQAAQIKAYETQTQQLVKQIQDLQAKVTSIESGKVLPEIAIKADDGPSTKDLDQKIRVIERKGEIAAEAADAKAKETPRLAVGPSGFALSSADTNFVLRLRGLVQLDSRTYINDNRLSKGNDGFLLRRVRPIIEGTLFRDFDFAVVPEFAGNAPSIFDAYLNYKYRPELQLRAGKFKSPVGFEQLQSDSTLPFNERSLVSALIPNRNVGVQLWGDIDGGLLSYAVGLFNGIGDGRSSGNNDVDDQKEFAGRIYAQPFKDSSVLALQGFGIGVGGTYSQVSSNATGLPNTTGGTLPGYSTDGQQQFFAYNPAVGTVVGDGSQYRVSPQLTYQLGPFGLLGEYAVSHQAVYNSATARRARLDHTAWDVSVQYVLTGENASFNGIQPKRPLNLGSGGWGAWQVVGRYGKLDVDDGAFSGFANAANSASAATSWAVGINWWLNRNARILTSFSHTSFEGGGAFNPSDTSTLVPPATVTRQDENAIFTRFQLAF